MKLQFRDSAVHISSDADGYLSAQADTGVNININGTDELAITSSTATFGTNIVIPNAATIGSVGDTDAVSISAGGVVNVSATTDSSSATTGGLTVSGGLGVAKVTTSGSFTDTVATLTAGSLTGLRVCDSNSASVTTLYGTSITDNTAMLHGGSITELVYVQSNTLSDGTFTAYSGSITNVVCLGVGTAGPDRKVDILDNSNPQLRLTHTDGSKGTDLQSDTNSLLTITPVDSKPNVLQLKSTDTTADSYTHLTLPTKP